MEETDAVSCKVCLCADELGSMIVFEIQVYGLGEPTEQIICRTCAATISKAWHDAEDELDRSEASDEPPTTT